MPRTRKARVFQKEIVRTRDKVSIQTLPLEVLSCIFELVVADYRVYLEIILEEVSLQSPRSLMILSGVSSYWRQVVWSTPRLWACLSIRISRTDVGDIPRLLELYLQNVGDIPFNITLIYISSLTLGEQSMDVVRPISDILVREEFSNKIRCIQLHDAPWGLLELVLPKLFRLESISLSSTCNPDPFSPAFKHISLAPLSQLRHVNFWGCWDIELPWTTITTLELFYVPIDQTIDLLLRSPNLIKFESDAPRKVGVDALLPTSLFNGITTFNHLEDFSWTYTGDPWSLEALRHIRLPVLRKLTYKCVHSHWREINPVIQALFSNLPNTLRSLHLYGLSDGKAPVLKYIFSQSASIESLVLTTAVNEPSGYSLLCTLCPGWDDDDDDRKLFLPSLKSLEIDAPLGTGWLDTDLRLRMLEICRARCGPGSKFKFHFKDFKMDPLVLEEMGAMVREDGFGLEVYCDGKEILRS